MTGHVKQIAVTGAAGQICYSLLFRIARGELYGPRQPISLRLLDLPQVQPALRGVVMELEDGAFPLLADVAVTDDARLAFRDIDAGREGAGGWQSGKHQCNDPERARA